MSVLSDLDKARFSVPQWYPDYSGTYWADGTVLDVPGGDYQVIENVRVIQKCMRQVYPLAVARIANRQFNSTPASIAQNKTYFMRPLRKCPVPRPSWGRRSPAKSIRRRMGTLKSHGRARVRSNCTWRRVRTTARKKITCNLMLDLTNYA